jgi:glycosyltransferase involved in cell wall biosynthesis
VKNNVETTVSKRMTLFKDAFAPDIPLKILFSDKPSIVIIHGLQHLLTLVSLIIYFLRKVPVILIVHGVYLTDSPLLRVRDRVLKLLFQVFRQSYLAIAITEYDKHLLHTRWAIPIENIAVTKVFLYLNNKELEQITQLVEKYKPTIPVSKTLRFLYLGRLIHEQKRVDHLVRLFHRFLQAEQYPPVELIIAGKGPLQGLLQKMVKRFGIQNYVKILGAVSDEEKWRQFLASTILVLVSEFEGLPRVIFEAFAAGKTVVVPNICGLREIVYDQVNGFLFDNDDEFLQLLHRLRINSQNISDIQHIARQMAMNKFNFEANKEELCKIIRKIAQ